LGATRVLVQLKSMILRDSSHELLDAKVLGFFGTKSMCTFNNTLMEAFPTPNEPCNTQLKI